MEIANVLDSAVVDLNMEAQNKDEALKYLSKKLKDAGYIENLDMFLKDIYYRESLDLTGIGEGVAIPHGQSESVKKIGIAIGKLNKPIKWETIDGKDVNLIFLFAVSKGNVEGNPHLKLLSSLARRLAKKENIKALKEAKTFADILQVFK
ncbi:PTS sugar transporter subunit IIA [Maledivibacter halophilus]|uniref:PTS system IIA component, Fru family (TC 4.A.2) n=1 Tax=Maledivibacter halophilus TaxID=36842 RepID=A0A1T5M957_9FIRM|nr:fructose PTS transporter subunit IIA [Maledivibacter halophilus]SKC84554.1 PTS system IIA component, Fru family (TC 4.A.2) [Maledivibacter halophilus]